MMVLIGWRLSSDSPSRNHFAIVGLGAIIAGCRIKERKKLHYKHMMILLPAVSLQHLEGKCQATFSVFLLEVYLQNLNLS